MKPSKIKSQNEIRKITASLKRQNKKIVTCSGCFDILHYGHIKFLQQARNKGGVLIVLLNSDRSVRSYKGPSRPIHNQNIRASVLSALVCVDFVVIFNETDPRKILDLLRPEIFCQGEDWGKNCIEKEVVERNGGKIIVVKKIKGFSTTQLINSLRKPKI